MIVLASGVLNTPGCYVWKGVFFCHLMFLQNKAGYFQKFTNLLKESHGSVDFAVQLSCPQNTASHRWQVPTNWWILSLFFIYSGHHFDVLSIILQKLLIHLIDAKVGDAQSDFNSEVIKR